MTVVQPRIWGPQDIAATTGVELDAVATLPNGGYVVTFRQDQKTGFQIYNGNGDKVGGTHFVDAPVKGAQWEPDILTYAADGSFAITWTEAAGALDPGRILRSQTFDINGNSKGAATTINSATQYDGAQTAADGQGSWATVYVEDVSGTKTLRFVERNQDGTFGAPLSIATANGVDDPELARISASQYVVSYGTRGANSGFMFSVVDASGVAASLAISNVEESEVVALKNADGTPTGKFVVTYATNGNPAQIVSKTYHYDPAASEKIVEERSLAVASGTLPGTGFALNTVALRDGGYAVAHFAGASDIWVRVVDAQGNAGPDFPIGISGEQVSPAISEMADGRLAVSWHNRSPASGGSTIETTIVDARAAAVTVTGTGGNDIYAPSKHVGDILDGGAGIDTLTFRGAEGGVSVNLGAQAGYTGDAAGDSYKNFENIIGSKFADILIGDGGGNVLQGEGGDDQLDGAAGADILNGGAGNDTFFVDNAGDVVQESAAADGGIDTIFTSVSYTLPAFVENMTATGTDAITLTGNDLNNVLTGNGAANVLNGGAGNDVLIGGAGADRMDGGTGNDIYYIDDANDVIVDGAGVDTAVVSVSYNLANLGSIENITGFGSGAITFTGGAGANFITGNDSNNILIGGAGNDTLSGGGGNDRIHGQEGRDVLTGGLGRDIFVFDKKPIAANIDNITDFNVRDDSIYLENKFFKVGNKGSLSKPAALAASKFYKGNAAHDADDRIIYDSKKGILWYDDDGIGGHKAVKITTMPKKLALKAGDFFVI